jgi:hypothetical protein
MPQEGTLRAAKCRKQRVLLAVLFRECQAVMGRQDECVNLLAQSSTSIESVV